MLHPLSSKQSNKTNRIFRIDNRASFEDRMCGAAENMDGKYQQIWKKTVGEKQAPIRAGGGL